MAPVIPHPVTKLIGAASPEAPSACALPCPQPSRLALAVLCATALMSLAQPALAQVLKASSALAPESVAKLKAHAGNAAAPEAPALSLLEAHALALQKDPTYIAELAIFRGASERITQAKAAFYPNVRFQASVARIKGSSTATSSLSETGNLVQDSETTTTANTASTASNTTTSDGTSVSTSTDSTQNTQSTVTERLAESSVTSSSETQQRAAKGWTTEGSLNLRWPVYNSANSETLAQSKLLVEQAELQLQAARNSVALRLVKAYMDVVVSRDALSAMASRKQSIAQQLAAARSGFANGDATIAAVREAQAVWDSALAQEVRLSNVLKIKAATLHTLTGAPIGRVQSLNTEGMLNAFVVPQNLEHWLDATKNQALTPKIAALSVRSAAKETQKLQSLYKPTVDVVASVGVVRDKTNFRSSASASSSTEVSGTSAAEQNTQATTTSTTQTVAPGFNDTGPTTTSQANNQVTADTTSVETSNQQVSKPNSISRASNRKWDAYVGVQISVPLFDGGLSNSKVREAAAQEDRRAAELMRAKQDAGLATETAFLELTSYLAEAKALKVAERSGEVALAASQLGYEVGMQASTEVLNAQQLVYATRSELGRVLAEALQAYLRLKSSAGTDSAQVLVEMSQWLSGPNR